MVQGVFWSLTFSPFGAALTSDAPLAGRLPAHWPQLAERNQDPGNQDQHYAQDHEVPQRKLRAPLRLFGKTEPGLATP